MTKPWEETWICEGAVVYRTQSDSAYDDEIILKGDGEDDARARLAAAAPEMARLLLSRYEKHAENDAGNDSTDWYCLACGRGGLPHAPDCRLVAVLRKAGVIG